MDCLACHKRMAGNSSDFWEHKPECKRGFLLFDLIRPPIFDSYKESTTQLVGIPHYERKRAPYVSELRELCKTKGINVKGLKKKELLLALS